MKVTCLLGSPRFHGNSTTMARQFCETLEKSGAIINYVALNQLNYRGCQACDACRTTHHQCILKDDLTDVLALAKESDVVVLASPVYFGDVSAQLKGFIDRCYGYIIPDSQARIKEQNISRLKTNTKFVMILAQKASEEYFDDLHLKYQVLFKMFLGIQEMLLIRGCSLDKPTEAANDLALMTKIKSMAEKFVMDLTI